MRTPAIYFFQIASILVPFNLHAQEQHAHFESKIRPVLVQHCYECHSSSARIVRGGLWLDSRQGIENGGDSGVLIDGNNPNSSLLIKALEHNELEMPPGKRLPQSVIDDFREWIRQGAQDPREEVKSKPLSVDPEKAATHWAFQPISNPSLPSISNHTWPANAIDSFVLHNLELREWTPSPAADKYTLIRRATFDLIGLPPSLDEIRSFLEDNTPNAYEKVIDRLLASPNYGEHWARHWLDVVRYADSNGADENHDFPHAWRYRDWVSLALNEDLPFDRFLQAQVAGDLQANDTLSEEENRQLITATGFLVIGPKMLAEQDKAKMRIDIIDEQIDTLSRAFLGITLACARCHDHKFDPLKARDYYALAGIFASTKTMADEAFVSKWMERPLPSRHISQLQTEYQPKIDATQAALNARIQLARDQLTVSGRFSTLPDNPETHFTEQDKKEIDDAKKSLEEIQKQRPAFDLAMAVEESKAQDLPVHLRGNHLKPTSDTVPRSVPERILATCPLDAIEASQSGRLQLANWLTSPSQPLTARVMVNRIWMWHFGKGLVQSPSNFGLQSEPPSHPELLDYLAYQWMSGGWSLKKLHRTILLSNTYRMSSRSTNYSESDPENQLLWRQNRKRLEVEPLRDSILNASGSLHRTLGGKPVGDAEHRRTMYLRIDRAALNDFLSTFDYVETASHIEQRPVTTVPYQALFLLNNPLVHEQASRLANKALETQSADDVARIQHLWLTLFSRPAHNDEVARCEQFLKQAIAERPASEESMERLRQVFAALVRSLFASNEFIYVE